MQVRVVAFQFHAALPILIGLLVRIACDSIVEESIRKALNQRGQDPAWRAAAWEALQLLDQPHNFAKAMKTEHVFALEGFDTLSGPQSGLNEEWLTQDGNRLIKTFSKIPRARAATNSRVHEIYSEFYTRLGTDPYDAKKISDASDWMDNRLNDAQGLSYTVVKILLPIFAEAGKACSRSDAQRNVLMQAIKLLENPNSKDLPLKGRYTLDGDAKPLRLIRKNNKLLIYSIGPNDIDDGGILERPTTGTRNDYDFGVAVSR